MNGSMRKARKVFNAAALVIVPCLMALGSAQYTRALHSLTGLPICALSNSHSGVVRHTVEEVGRDLPEPSSLPAPSADFSISIEQPEALSFLTAVPMDNRPPSIKIGRQRIPAPSADDPDLP